VCRTLSLLAATPPLHLALPPAQLEKLERERRN
jgi:hypothetical protein